MSRSTLTRTRVMRNTRMEQSSSDTESQTACLVFISGERIGRRLDLSAPELLVGREASCDIAIKSDLISRQHAKFITRGEATLLLDMNSTNGTFVNDERIRSRELVDGDRIAVGKVVMKYLAAGSAEAGYHDEVYRLVSHDGLTNVYNKRYFQEHLTSLTGKDHGRVSVIVFDADHFKAVNDTYGHAAGDAVLCQLADCARRSLPERADLARVGGEEFTVLGDGMPHAEALKTAEAIRKAVEDHEFRFGDLVIPVTISVGVATLEPGEPESGEGLFKRADENLYRAKQGGRNRVCS